MRLRDRGLIESAMARRSPATAGYCVHNSSRLPISTSAGTTPGHSVLAPRNQRSPISLAAWNVSPGISSCTRWPLGRSGPRVIRSAEPPACNRTTSIRIAQIIMIELVIADAVKPHRRASRHHEVQRRAQRPRIGEWRRQPAGGDHPSWSRCLLQSLNNPQVADGGVAQCLERLLIGRAVVGCDSLRDAREFGNHDAFL
jgi:hypothetical protein